ncbi:MAG: HypC/HybG/HupF family hydrogenase formation chaperone [Candidatus Marinimicrobia bacterium]|nr:HypC/HybG/HupF family hydrogenase formation chaperone [Candidatus Neomarinimicrobiota bacterium]
MCLGIPGKVIEVYEENGLMMGRIDFAGTISQACLAYVPEIEVGQYTIVHAGFGISVINEEEALKSYQAWEGLVEAAAQEGVDLYGQPLPEESGGAEE